MKTNNYFHKATEGENITAHFKKALLEKRCKFHHPWKVMVIQLHVHVLAVKLGYLTHYYIIYHGNAK